MRFCFACVLAACLMTHAMTLHAVEIIAHRGASHDAPENTLAAFKLAWQQAADAVELDIRRSSDGQIVVIHDADAKRTAGVDAAVAKWAFVELRTLDAGSWKGMAWKGEKLPTLRESLTAIPNGKRMFIEIKCGKDVLPALESDMKASGRSPEQLVLIGFKYETMVAAKQRLPRHQVYWIVSGKSDKKKKPPRLEDLIEKAKAGRLDGLDLDWRFPIDARWVSQIKAAGLGLYVWTVDEPAMAARLVAAGVDGITTNRPGWLREQLKQFAQAPARSTP